MSKNQYSFSKIYIKNSRKQLVEQFWNCILQQCPRFFTNSKILFIPYEDQIKQNLGCLRLYLSINNALVLNCTTTIIMNQNFHILKLRKVILLTIKRLHQLIRIVLNILRYISFDNEMFVSSMEYQKQKIIRYIVEFTRSVLVQCKLVKIFGPKQKFLNNQTFTQLYCKKLWEIFWLFTNRFLPTIYNHKFVIFISKIQIFIIFVKNYMDFIFEIQNYCTFTKNVNILTPHMVTEFLILCDYNITCFYCQWKLTPTTKNICNYVARYSVCFTKYYKKFIQQKFTNSLQF
eukprot:TRINITY_DN1246_c1_g1_i15.p1 TRINITY_DN1246_c1_g1~~TRINITY_DN1246_c1_g1_i15.p1  ORF type:complete len:289 (+),score=-35.43 TRINITY_DN1246_c1_g1_i15:205-1071(+)